MTMILEVQRTWSLVDEGGSVVITQVQWTVTAWWVSFEMHCLLIGFSSLDSLSNKCSSVLISVKKWQTFAIEQILKTLKKSNDHSNKWLFFEWLTLLFTWRDDQAIPTAEINNKQVIKPFKWTEVSNEQVTKLLEEDEVSKKWGWASHSNRLMFPTNRQASHLNGLMFPTTGYQAVQTADKGLVNRK